MIDNFATVGKSWLSIYGYGPINSEVALRGRGISERTTSDSTGLFRFSSVYNFTYSYPELCIQAVDNEKRVTQPTCIPPLPKDILVPFEVGPILLSPTLSLSNNKVVAGSESYLSGKTTPNTETRVYIASGKGYFLPVLGISSDDKGGFDINMPTSDIAEYKIFASTNFNDNLSAKSNTLQFAVISSVISVLQRLWNFLLQNKLMAFIIVEVLIFIMLFISVACSFINALKSTKKGKKRHTEGDYLEYLKS